MCVVDDTSKVLCERKVPTKPDGIAVLLTSVGGDYVRVAEAVRACWPRCNGRPPVSQTDLAFDAKSSGVRSLFSARTRSVARASAVWTFTGRRFAGCARLASAGTR